MKMTALNKATLKTRELINITVGVETSDGDGVRMTRLIGTQQLEYLDPFLMLDAFGSDNPSDYIKGFPSHPHRGFETVSYLLAGMMHHKDNKGNQGIIEAGGVQWMTAGKGIVHSEIPKQDDGLLKGFQLWVNLPAKDKMVEPSYQEFSPSDIPVEYGENGTEIRVISGKTMHGTEGVVKNDYVNPIYMDVTIAAEQGFEQTVSTEDNAFIYMLEGSVRVGESALPLSKMELGILDKGELISITAQEKQARFLLISATPLNEPVARGGPFVMNTQAEIRQAFRDFQNNRL